MIIGIIGKKISRLRDSGGEGELNLLPVISSNNRDLFSSLACSILGDVILRIGQPRIKDG